MSGCAERSFDLPLGHRSMGGAAVTMPMKNLNQHTVILAGAGAGKTVLLRRLIEEAALLDTPSIVIDCANDLSSLGQAWPHIPESWSAEDRAKARRFQEKTELVVWTPGKDSGNPLVLKPLPDFAAIADNRDQLREAIMMACAFLRPLVAPGDSLAATKKLGILQSAMRYFAAQRCSSLAELADLLCDLPPEATLGVQKETKLAVDMADTLRVHMEIDPLLRPRGQTLDPAVLFGDGPGCRKLRISVINMLGLPSLELQQQFLNQLAMTLFGWIKKYPCPPERPLRGLLAIDEARDYVPSIKNSVCKESLKRLAAQARKYGLGLVFATQHPKDIDNKLIANCSTQYYGKANAPAAIDAIKEQIQLRGGHGSDIAKLPKGTFYVFNADAGLKGPEKVKVPLCLSYHRPTPLDGQEIIQLAKECRHRFADPAPALTM